VHRSELLFRKYDLRGTLEQHKNKARGIIASSSRSRIEGPAGESLITELEKDYRVAPLVLLEDQIGVESEETKVDVSDDPMRAVFDRSRPCLIAGQRLRYIVPFQGDAMLWNCKPSTFNLNPPRGVIEGSELILEFEVPNDKVSRTRQYFDDEWASVKQYIGYGAADVDAHNQNLEKTLRDALIRRREQSNQTEQQIENLGLPVRKRAAAPSTQAQTPPNNAKPDRKTITVSKEYDVALSFAGENRAYVEEVAGILQVAGVKVFYDKFETVQLWGQNLADHLGEVYGKRSRFVVMFVSTHYPLKAWPTHERQSAQARAIKENKIVLLPARFDDTEIPGLPATTGYIDLKNTAPNELAELIKQKLRE
jgi:hypothetical protein